MIEITMPRPGENIYAVIGGGIVGPIRSDGTPSGETISYRHDTDYLEEARMPKFIGDNDVWHHETHGEIHYVPVVSELTSSPSADYPEKQIWKTHYLSPAGLAVTVNPNYGLVGHRVVSRNMLGTQCQNLAWTILDSTKFTYTMVTAYKSNPTKITNLSEHSYQFVKISGGSIYWTYTQTTYDLVNGVASAMDLSHTNSYDQIIAFRDSQTRKVVGSPQQSIGTPYVCNTPLSASIGPVQAVVDTFINQHLYPVPFPVEDKDYGDLAMEASKTRLANDVNMISFLKDLRHPTEMIPKLRELKKLKGIANNYLTVNYGVLPTIDDLRTIFRALHKRKDYVDKHGHKVYTAGFTATKDLEDNSSHTLVQRIKLAIKDEDAGLIDLIDRIDSAGFAPTLVNLWDLVPYSFVIDWFIDVGSLLERVDTMVRLARYDIVYVTMSRKTTSVVNINPSVSLPYKGSIKSVHYRRWVSGQCPVPPLSLQPTFQDFNHWLESSALLVQRIKR